MSVKTRKEIRDDRGDLIGVIEWTEDADAVVTIGIGGAAEEMPAQFDTSDMVDLLTVLGEAARFLGVDPAGFFAPDEESEPEAVE